MASVVRVFYDKPVRTRDEPSPSTGRLLGAVKADQPLARVNLTAEGTSSSDAIATPEGRRLTRSILRAFVAGVGGELLRQAYRGRPIRALAWSQDEDSVTFWTVIDEYDPELVDHIIQAEAALVQRVSAVEIDFRTVFAQGRPPEAVIPTSAQLIS